MPMIFEVNLETLNNLGHKPPYNSTEGTNFKQTRSTFFPDFLRDNHTLKHGDRITVSGERAVYLKNNFTTGPDAFLIYISGTAV